MAPLPTLLELIQSGYVAKSGNSVKLIAADKRGASDGRIAAVANWKRRPSAEDKAELERILSAGSKLQISKISEHGKIDRSLLNEIKEWLG